MTTANIASHLPAMAKLDPIRPAIIAKERGAWRTLTFGEFDALSDVYARGLTKAGIGRGVRTVMMAPPSLEFFPLVFGLFKAGAVIVMIDPGIGRRALLSCLDEVKAEAFIGVPQAHLARLLFPRPFRTVRALVTVGRRWFWGGHTTQSLQALGREGEPMLIDPVPGETAAILFTSGSTGIPKGAVYSHEMFDSQLRQIRDLYGITPGEVDLPTFPLFALFDPALGMTAVLPEMDFRFPAKAEPARLVEAIETYRCTNMFGSPALLDNLGRYGATQGVKLPTLKRVLSAGAPVRNDVLERMQGLLQGDAQVYTPFGATESLPVASIGSKEVLADTAKGAATGQGVCVGRPAPEALVRIIRVTDEPIAEWSDALQVPQGTIGEITVRGPMVTHEYFARPEQTKAAKLRDGAHVVHRMGDVGYFDAQGRLWMCGRKSHRVEAEGQTFFSVPVEEILNQHPAIKRSALVGPGARGSQTPWVLLEREPSVTMDDATVLEEVRELAARFDVTRPLKKFHLYPGSFPVDARHNAKIEREKLTQWAQEHVS